MIILIISFAIYKYKRVILTTYFFTVAKTVVVFGATDTMLISAFPIDKDSSTDKVTSSAKSWANLRKISSKHSANPLHPNQMVSYLENNILMSDFLNFVSESRGSIRPDR